MKWLGGGKAAEYSYLHVLICFYLNFLYQNNRPNKGPQRECWFCFISQITKPLQRPKKCWNGCQPPWAPGNVSGSPSTECNQNSIRQEHKKQGPVVFSKHPESLTKDWSLMRTKSSEGVNFVETCEAPKLHQVVPPGSITLPSSFSLTATDWFITGLQLPCFPNGSAVKNLSAVQETQVWSLGGKDPLEKGMATHSSILA